MSYGNFKEPLLPREAFFRRLLRHGGLAGGIILVSLFIGILGYHCFEDLGWIDALLNASMILGGMGPVNPLKTTGGKLFASFYALYSGGVFLAAAGLVLAPILHRLMHHFHLESSDGEPK